MRSLAVRLLLVLASTAALVGVLIWPWPAPDVDWRAPVDRALAAGDCTTAVTIADAAAAAGSGDAHKMLKGLVEGGRCDRQPAERAGMSDAFAAAYRQSSGAFAYGLTENDLGRARSTFVSATLFLCATPYNGSITIDNAALSGAVPASRGPVMSWHRLRRQTCITILEHAAERLLDDGDTPAKEVAGNLLIFPPAAESPQAGFLFASLVLDQAFVPRSVLGNQRSTTMLREWAWLRLKEAANAGNAGAIRSMIDLLHRGRFRARDDSEAYFWILRQRRLGLPGTPADTEIERSLDEGERDGMQMIEDAIWRSRNDDGSRDPASAR